MSKLNENIFYKKDTETSCLKHVRENGIAMDQLQKKDLKAIGTMLPDYSFNPVHKQTYKNKSCIIPDSISHLYSTSTDTCAFNYNFDNVNESYKLQSKTGKEASIDGCAFNINNNTPNFIRTAGNILDYDTQVYIQQLKETSNAKVIEYSNHVRLRDQRKAERDNAKNVHNVHTQYITTLNSRYDNHITFYNNEIDRYQTSNFVLSQTTIPNLVNVVRENNTDRNKQRSKNIKELSMVTVTTRNNGPTQTYEMSNVIEEFGNLEVPYVGDHLNDKINYLYLPRGIEAESYEHIDFTGRKNEYNSGNRVRPLPWWWWAGSGRYWYNPSWEAQMDGMWHDVNYGLNKEAGYFWNRGHWEWTGNGWRWVNVSDTITGLKLKGQFIPSEKNEDVYVESVLTKKGLTKVADGNRSYLRNIPHTGQEYISNPNWINECQKKCNDDPNCQGFFEQTHRCPEPYRKGENNTPNPNRPETSTQGCYRICGFYDRGGDLNEDFVRNNLEYGPPGSVWIKK